jgi:hypothetical protein
MKLTELVEYATKKNVQKRLMTARVQRDSEKWRERVQTFIMNNGNRKKAELYFAQYSR